MIRRLLLTGVYSTIIIALTVLAVMGVNSELPWDWLNIAFQAFWVILWVIAIVLTVWDKLD